MSKIDNIVKSGGFDFHCHSTVSDGKYTVRELCDMAVGRNFSMLSITDHNSIASNINEVKKIYKKQGLDVVIGSELTGVYGGTGKSEEIHIVALNFNPRKLSDIFEKTQKIEELISKQSFINCTRKVLLI